MAQYLKIHELSGINASSIPHLATTGDDRGGIAITEDNVFVTGEDATGVFAQDLLTPAASTGVVYDGIFSDLATGALFTLATDATTPVVAGATEITHIIPLDPDTARPGTAIALSQPIVVSALGGNGIFVSLGRVVIYSNVDNGAYEIDLTTPNIGTVTDIGHIPRPDMEDTDQGWASWGVAEFFDGVTHLAYVADDTAVPDAIMRTAVPSGDTEVIGTLRGLADMASFTVSPDDGRWYFHFEDGGSGSQFGVLEGSSGNEFVGFADAIIATNAALAGDGNSNTIAGTASEDIISGGGGGDSLAGLAGDDALVGDGGDDTLDGGVDDDHLLGGGGDDSLAGGNGNDIAVFSGKFLDYHIVGLGNGEYTVAGPARRLSRRDRHAHRNRRASVLRYQPDRGRRSPVHLPRKRRHHSADRGGSFHRDRAQGGGARRRPFHRCVGIAPSPVPKSFVGAFSMPTERLI